MNPPRGVRFIDTGAPDGSSSQLQKHSITSSQPPVKERVVKSIFSQTYHAQPLPLHPPPPPPIEPKTSGLKTPAKSSQEKKRHVYFSPETMTYGETSSRSDLAGGLDELYIAGPAMTIISPMSCVTNVTDFNSPVTSRERRSVAVESPIAVGLNTTLNSIDMLNFDYIENCNRIDDLWHIIRLLKKSKNESPQLLKAAKDRVRILLKLHGMPTPPPPPPQPPTATKVTPSATAKDDSQVQDDVASPSKADFGQWMANISRITNGNTTLDSIDPSKSSLNFSLSPSSVLQGIDLVETPTIAGTFVNNAYVEGRSRRLLPILESPNVELGRPFPRPPPPQFYNKEGRFQDAPNAMQIKSVSIGKVKIPANSESIGPQSGSGDIASVEQRQQQLSWMEEFRKVQLQHQVTQKTLDMTRAELQKKDLDTRAMEGRLESRISELTKALSEIAEKSRLVVGAERTIRIQCEQELSKQNRKNSELNKELREMLENLEQMKRRHLLFRLDLLKATGMSNAELKNLSQNEFVSSLSKKMTTLKEENEKMSKCLEEAKKAIDDRNIMGSKLCEAERVKEHLESENARLAEKIEELRAEVKSGRAYIDKLLQTSHDTKQEDWEKQEEKYRSVICTLRQQIRKQASVVSINLYKDAKNESRKSLAELRIAEGNIEKLKEKLTQLEKDNHRISKPLRTPKASSSKQPNRSIFLSPTDRLEQGLLRSSQEKHIYTAKKTPQTPKSSGKTPQVGRGGDVTASSFPAKGKADLTGMTISFRKGEILEDDTASATKSGDQIRLKTTAQSTRAKQENGVTPRSDELWKNVSRDPNRMEPLNHFANVGEKSTDSDAPLDGKENNLKTQRSESRASPIERVRAYGGRRALQEKVRKMKLGSPKLLNSVAQRQVQIILH